MLSKMPWWLAVWHTNHSYQRNYDKAFQAIPQVRAGTAYHKHNYTEINVNLILLQLKLQILKFTPWHQQSNYPY